MIVPVIIPAYEPDERLLELLGKLKEKMLTPVIVVNDGSGEQYNEIFNKAAESLTDDGTVITYDRNRGKGYALKTAFEYVIHQYPNAIGCVTADSDGQHTADAISEVRSTLFNHSESLILGTRTFNKDDIPWKSRFGNKLTVRVFKNATGVLVHDTQTGLRGIPLSFMRDCLQIKENRFEFEMRMLIDSTGKYPVIEVPIETIYDSKENHKTHFDPLKDSIRIYKLLMGRFFRYILSSLSSSILDLVMFEIFCLIFRGRINAYVAAATIYARIISAVYNYSVNYKLVFRSRENVAASVLKYAALAVIQMSLSALLVTAGVKLITMVPEVAVKAVVDTCLFFISYYVQKKFVYRKINRKADG